jgi:hypothetical protein
VTEKKLLQATVLKEWRAVSLDEFQDISGINGGTEIN